MTVVIGQPESSTFSGLGIKNNISRIKKSINSKFTCNNYIDLSQKHISFDSQQRCRPDIHDLSTSYVNFCNSIYHQ